MLTSTLSGLRLRAATWPRGPPGSSPDAEPNETNSNARHPISNSPPSGDHHHQASLRISEIMPVRSRLCVSLSTSAGGRSVRLRVGVPRLRRVGIGYAALFAAGGDGSAAFRLLEPVAAGIEVDPAEIVFVHGQSKGHIADGAALRVVGWRRCGVPTYTRTSPLPDSRTPVSSISITVIHARPGVHCELGESQPSVWSSQLQLHGWLISLGLRLPYRGSRPLRSEPWRRVHVPHDLLACLVPLRQATVEPRLGH